MLQKLSDAFTDHWTFVYLLTPPLTSSPLLPLFYLPLPFFEISISCSEISTDIHYK